MKSALILEDGHVFAGQGFAASGDRFCQAVFHTGMVGLAETLTEPACTGQAVVSTYPLAGNCGVCNEDFDIPRAGALIVSEISELTSNFRCDESLEAVLKRFDIPGISGVDTRFLVRLLRTSGSMRAMVTSDESRFSGPGLEKTLAELASWTAPDPYGSLKTGGKTYNPDGKKRVALLNTGAREADFAALCERGVCVKTYGHDTSAAAILADKPDGLLLAGGPDALPPEALIETVRALRAAGLPVLAVEQGHLLLALAAGAEAERLPCGHRGANYAVRDCAAGNVYITSQNHGWAVKQGSLPKDCAVAYENVNDGTIAGLRYKNGDISAAFNPDGCLGAPDLRAVADEFVKRMEV